MTTTTDWIIKGGIIYDGSGAPSFQADIKISGDKIVAIAPDIAVNGEQLLNASGLIVTPGLIDLHVHVYDGMNIHSIAPADAGLKTGVTTMLDMGSAGTMNYGTFHKYVIPAAQETIFTLLNISSFGVQGHPDIPPYVGDLHDPLHFDAATAVRCIEAQRGEIIGVKVRLTDSLADDDPAKERSALKAALEVRDTTGLPIYVHHVMSNIPLEELLPQLQAGDVLTHFYHGHRGGGFTGPDGAPGEALQSARERGVWLDLGHGVGSFSWEVAEAACQQHGFWPDAISTDIHAFNLETPVVDLPTTMSKFLHLGQPLKEVVRCTTLQPATIMGQQDKYGLLTEGRLADISLLRQVEGNFKLIDSHEQERVTNSRLEPISVFKNGQHFTCRSY